MLEDIQSCTLFSTALCNLNCEYCYICKDAGGNLKKIDDDLASDWENNIYLKRLLELDPCIKNNLSMVEIWGGEPFLHFDRFLNHFQEWAEALPNFNELRWSTNFTIPNQVQTIEKLFNLIEKYSPQKQFNIDCQISIDGPEEFTDKARGMGVTSAILKNFNDLCKLKFNTDKIKLTVHPKSTFSRETLFTYFYTEEQIYNWYKFFSEEMYQPYIENNCKWDFSLGMYTLAMPTDWSSEDGVEYAKILSKIVKLTPKIKHDFPCWKSFYSLVPEVNDALRNHPAFRNIHDREFFSYDDYVNLFDKPSCGGHCGAIRYGVTLIPHNKFTVCHRGIFDSYLDYCNTIHNLDDFHGLSKEFFLNDKSKEWVYDKEEMIKMYNLLGNLCHKNHQIWYTDLLINVQEAAKAQIIDPKYQDRSLIQLTAPVLLTRATCIQDNLLLSGSWMTPPFLEIPLLYNGAMDIILNELDRLFKEKLHERKREL